MTVWTPSVIPIDSGSRVGANLTLLQLELHMLRELGIRDLVLLHAGYTRESHRAKLQPHR